MAEAEFPSDRLDRILVAIETIEESLAILVRKQSLTRSEYKADSDSRDIVERRFVKMTEATLDVGEELVKHERGHPPESNPQTMRLLGELDVLSSTLAEELANAARFRNVLSHTYGDVINDDIVYNALNDLDRYRRFVVAVRDYLDAIGALDDG